MKHVAITLAQHIRWGPPYPIHQLGMKKVFATDETCSYYFSSAHKMRPPRIPIQRLGMKKYLPLMKYVATTTQDKVPGNITLYISWVWRKYLPLMNHVATTLAQHIKRGLHVSPYIRRKYLPLMKHVATSSAQHIRRGLQYLIRQLAKKKVFATDETCSYYFSSAHKMRTPISHTSAGYEGSICRWWNM